MLAYRPASERGVANMGWLQSRHSFSFGHYYDPNHMGFGPLRVINDDRVQAGAGFPKHGHQNMEIISYVLDGALEHKDTIGNSSIIRPGDVQRMSAGTGIQHSEYNASNSENVHFLQIWIIPEKNGLQPSYEQINFTEDQKEGKLKLVGSRGGRDGSVTIHQDVDLYASILHAGDAVQHTPKADRLTWIHVAAGQGRINGLAVEEGDGMAFNKPEAITVEADEKTEFLLFDMARA